jgi:hypothetical protein
MSAAVDDIRLTFARESSNAEPYLGEGWHGAEVRHRWTDGLRSVVRLPPFRAQPWFLLTLQGWALELGGVSQTLSIALNGTKLRRARLDGGTPRAMAVSGGLIRGDGENILTFEHPEAVRPSEAQPGNKDTRMLAFAFQRLDFEPLDEPLSLAPRLLPPAPASEDAAEAKAVAETFQSLGQSCDLGNFQRDYGAEPFGLLRFAGIFPVQLIQGLRTRFVGVGDIDQLSFFTPEGSRELHGKHAVYGLNYHTFKFVDETDVADLVVKEARRLGYLARLFFEQLENNEKIFLRAEHFEAPEEALALHQLLRTFHPRARLLLLQVAPPSAPERLGRVIELRPGLYRGYLSRMSDPARNPIRPLSEEWLRLCSAVVAYESARG